ncbi:MAG TPA: DUF6364 family protein [Chitinophagales bacterium]|nr:DUF6364 family protein [Chitinophagales bacterium]
MTTKLTLTVEQSTIERAKRFAKNNGRSLSDLVETYLEQIAKNDSTEEQDLPAGLKNLFGSVRIPNSLNHKKEIRKIMSSKKI